MDITQLPIRVAVGRWSRTFLSEFLLLKSVNLNKFLFFADPERFQQIKFSLNNENVKQRKKFVQLRTAITMTQGLARCLEHFSYLTHQQ